VAAAGFSLIEALVALTITSLAGAVLLLSVQTALDTTVEAVDKTIADGIAQQMLDEILTKRYIGPAESPLATTLGPLTSELRNLGTSLFDDVDDYSGYVARPLTGIFGEILGTGDDNGNARQQSFCVRSDYFQNWRLRVDVYYVDPTNHLLRSASPTNVRMVEVNVELMRANGAAFPLANRKRVLAYVAPPSS
jgi:type II secretory pathway pseudopilin PulG